MAFFNPLKHFRQPDLLPPAEAPRLNSPEKLALISQSHYVGVVPYNLKNGGKTLVALFEYTDVQGQRDGAYATLHEQIHASIPDLAAVPGSGNISDAIKKTYRDNYVRSAPRKELDSRAGLTRAGLRTAALAASSGSASTMSVATSRSTASSPRTTPAFE